jgi:hypothetical protein
MIIGEILIMTRMPPFGILTHQSAANNAPLIYKKTTKETSGVLCTTIRQQRKEEKYV